MWMLVPLMLLSCLCITSVNGRVTVQPHVAAVNIGGSITLKCSTTLKDDSFGPDWKHEANHSLGFVRVYGSGVFYNGYRQGGRFLVTKASDGDFVLTINNVQQSDAGKYACIENGERDTLVLDVFDSHVRVKSETTVVGTSLTLKCETGKDWKFTPLAEVTTQDVGTKNTRSLSINNSSDVEIRNAQEDDSGVYACYRPNQKFELKLVTIVVLEVLPNFEICPSDMVRVAGNDAIFRATTQKGHALRWYRNNGSIAGPGQHNFSKGRQYDVIDSRPGQLDLVIKEITRDDAGQYKCQQVEGFQHTDVNLVVLEEEPAYVYRSASNGNMGVTCSVKYTGRPKPVVGWEDKDGKTLNETAGKMSDNFTLTMLIISGKSVVRCKIYFALKQCGKYVEPHIWTSPWIKGEYVGHHSDSGVAELSQLSTVIILVTFGFLVFIVTPMLIVLFVREICKIKLSSKRTVNTVPEPLSTKEETAAIDIPANRPLSSWYTSPSSADQGTRSAVSTEQEDCSNHPQLESEDTAESREDDLKQQPPKSDDASAITEEKPLLGKGKSDEDCKTQTV